MKYSLLKYNSHYSTTYRVTSHLNTKPFKPLPKHEPLAKHKPNPIKCSPKQ